MRRFLIWIFRLGLGAIALALIAVAVVLVVHARQLDRLKRLASTPPSVYIVEQSPSIVVDHVRVIDGSGAPPQEDQSIVIESGKITFVGPSAGRPNLPANKVLDLRGRTVFPGWSACTNICL